MKSREDLIPRIEQLILRLAALLLLMIGVIKVIKVELIDLLVSLNY